MDTIQSPDPSEEARVLMDVRTEAQARLSVEVGVEVTIFAEVRDE